MSTLIAQIRAVAYTMLVLSLFGWWLVFHGWNITYPEQPTAELSKDDLFAQADNLSKRSHK